MVATAVVFRRPITGPNWDVAPGAQYLTLYILHTTLLVLHRQFNLHAPSFCARVFVSPISTADIPITAVFTLFSLFIGSHVDELVPRRQGVHDIRCSDNLRAVSGMRLGDRSFYADYDVSEQPFGVGRHRNVPATWLSMPAPRISDFCGHKEGADFLNGPPSFASAKP